MRKEKKEQKEKGKAQGGNDCLFRSCRFIRRQMPAVADLCFAVVHRIKLCATHAAILPHENAVCANCRTQYPARNKAN